MPAYDVFMHLRLLDAVPKGGLQRRRILAFISSLSEHPATPGDYTERNALSQDRQVKIVGESAVYHRPVDAVKRVMVTSVRKADRADPS